VTKVHGHYQTLLGLSPEKGGFANDPVLGLVENLGIHGTLLSVTKIYVGLLAATILFIATNAGVIGASRITYAMASYRQLPEVFRRLHPKFKTPWLSLVVFAGIFSILAVLPGKTDFLGTMYSFGAMLSFTVAHVSIVALRRKARTEDVVYRSRPNITVRGVSWPLFALVGGLGTGGAWLVVVIQDSATRWAGLGWIAIGFVLYAVYRRRYVGEPLQATVRAPAAFGPALALEYRRLLVPIVAGQPSDNALDVACGLAAERRSQIIALNVIEVPLDLPLSADLPGEEERSNRELDEAQAIGDSYGVTVVDRMVRARSAGEAIVEEAERRGIEIIVVGSPRRVLAAGARGVFGSTVDYVLKHAPCRVMVAAADTPTIGTRRRVV
jgi:APA family basic amino acid/polyamine antiporter